MAEHEVGSGGKDLTGRRVYNLPQDLLERLRAYQISQGLSSEAEAARRLLHTALQMRDGVKDILDTLSARYKEERDLRVLAGDLLSKHILVESIKFKDDGVFFRIKNGEAGLIRENGSLFYGYPDSPDDHLTEYVKKPVRIIAKSSPPWEPSKGGDLDEEIPF